MCPYLLEAENVGTRGFFGDITQVHFYAKLKKNDKNFDALDIKQHQQRINKTYFHYGCAYVRMSENHNIILASYLY